MAGRGWDKRFDMPIELPDGASLKTLRDAIKHLAKVIPAKERDMPQVKTAADLLTRGAEGSDAWLFFARVAVGQALRRHDVREFNPDRKDHHWGKRKLKRDE